MLATALCAGTLALGAQAPAALADQFLAGAGVETTTPPAAGSAAGNQANAAFGSFSSCPSQLFSSGGRFALQEPFNDLNGNNQWDAGVDISPIIGKQNPPTASGPPEPYCDANANGHWDGIYAPNGSGPMTGVHDDIEARAVALSDGHDKPVVYISVAQIGIFDAYTDQVRADLANTYHRDADVVVSANHNESSPESIGLYGALQSGLGAGARSGIDEYFMSFLADRAAKAANDAIANLQPATLWANQVEGPIPLGQQNDSYPLLSGLSQRISDQFPTAVKLPGDNRVAAVDTKMGLLQARRSDGSPLFTVVSQAAHNQEMGNAGSAISADWPGAMQNALDGAGQGTGVFLVADNGSEEDPQTSPTVIPRGSENHSNQATQFIQAQATGVRFAQVAVGAAQFAQELHPGTVRLNRKQTCIPLENNAFIALGAAGVFGKRQGYVCDPSGNPIAPVPNGFVAPTASSQFRTYLSYADLGPDFQLVDNPGESFPALMLGSPFGAETASCPRANPAVPAWHAKGLFRFMAGLSDDLIGYLIPAWGFAAGAPGLFSTDSCYQDAHGHGHKLETESIGPTGSNDVANGLSGMLDAEKDTSAHIARGRFVLADGSYSHWPTGRDQGPAPSPAVAILIPDQSQSALDPNAGTLIGAPGTAGMGGRAVDATGVFMDYDGQPQAHPDVTTRGMMVFDSKGCVAGRFYLDVFPTLDQSKPLGAVQPERPAIPPNGNCPTPGANGVTPIQIGAGVAAGVLPASALNGLSLAGQAAAAATAARLAARCAGSSSRSAFALRGVGMRRRVLRLYGRARGPGCGLRIRRVTVSMYRKAAGRCRFLTPQGTLSAARSCTKPVLLLVHGTSSWRLSLRVRLARGRYTLVVGAVDSAGRSERTRRRGNIAVLRVGPRGNARRTR